MGKAKFPESVRIKVLSRDGYICRACGFGGSENYAGFLDCDHIESEFNGGKSDCENLQTLCKVCNVNKGVNNWRFEPRNSAVSESVWAVNQKIVRVAFTVGIKENNIPKTLKRLK